MDPHATKPELTSEPLDLSKPLSVLLREGTKGTHQELEQLPAAGALAGGQLAKSEYIRYLFMLWHVYDELERGLYEHRENPVILNIYHPRVFSRASTLSFDICHHLDTVTWQTDPFYVGFYDNIPAEVRAYADRVAYLGRPDASPEDVSRLAAHAYVRYMGDLSGGQSIRRRIVKAYELYDDGDGAAFYNFRTLDPRTGDKPAESHEVRKIKEWFRNGLDEVTDAEVKTAILDEANAAFQYNAGIFRSIDSKKKLSVEPLPQQSAFASTGASVGALVAVIMAVSLAHFGLVVGGYTGASGMAKLDTVVQWMKTGGAGYVEPIVV